MRNKPTQGAGAEQRQIIADPKRCVTRFRELLTALGRNRSLRDPIASACEAMQYTPAQFHAMMWLFTDGVLTMGELARLVAVTEKTVTGIVDRLEADSVVARVRDDSDRRVVRVALTEAGLERAKRVDGQLSDKLLVLMKRLDGADRQSLFRILQKLVLLSEQAKHHPGSHAAAPAASST